MRQLTPTFELRLGSHRSTSERPAGGPVRLVVARDMAIAVDALDVSLTTMPDMAPNDPVELELGYEASNELVFTGELASLTFSPHGARVLALGSMNRLVSRRQVAFFSQRSTGSIVNELLRGSGVAAGTVSEGPTMPVYAIGRWSSVYQHVKALADRLGYELYADRNGRVMFHGLGAAAELDSPEGALGGSLGSAASGVTAALGVGIGQRYAYGQNLIKLSATARGARRTALEVGGESPMSREGDKTVAYLTANDEDFRGTAGRGDAGALILDASARTKDLADRFARGLLATLDRRRHTARLSVLGRPSLDLGATLTISQAPNDAANGQGYVRALRHRFSAREGFATDVELVRETS